MKPTIILVHGAFAESASWDGVIDPLLEAGHPVIAAANPLRDPVADAAGVADLVRTIDGPVLLVAHSYGGAVISNVPAGAGEITGLVYVNGFAPDPDESAFSLAGKSRAACSARRRCGLSRAATALGQPDGCKAKAELRLDRRSRVEGAVRGGRADHAAETRCREARRRLDRHRERAAEPGGARGRAELLPQPRVREHVELPGQGADEVEVIVLDRRRRPRRIPRGIRAAAGPGKRPGRATRRVDDRRAC